MACTGRLPDKFQWPCDHDLVYFIMRNLLMFQVGAGGKKSRLLLAMSTAAEFRDYLTDFSEHYASLGPPNPDNLPEDGKLKSETMVKENRRYYLDLKENQRGRFLRVRSNYRTAVTIPERCLVRFRDVLSEYCDRPGCKDNSH
ncbi:hypothetical protein KUTeg_023094 [Tegillarca granosa]|uniref:Uncharacterized protein n=1 Tax=Tegillarca granosa TaxID=220873 RepID=A0ABQ9E119_TEGGR|nr:hypothetical protein KUTeg_023094 [Tegillarca granosa]